MISKVNEHALKSVDIMGPLMELLSNSIEETPYYEPDGSSIGRCLF